MAQLPEVMIHRPIGEVFDYLADFSTITQYTTSFESMTKQGDAPVGKGTVFAYRMTRRNLEGTVEISDYEPNRRFSWTGPFAGPVSPQGGYTFEETPEGTRVIGDPQPKFRGPMRLMEPLMRPMIRRDAGRSLQKVKAILESRG